MKKRLPGIFTSGKQIVFVTTILIGSFFISTIFSIPCFAQNTVIDSLGEAYFFYKGDYPEDGTPSWGDEDWAANGITHDNNFWYITSVSRNEVGITDSKDWILWKVPISEPLDQDFSNNPNVKSWRHSFHPTTLQGYGHAGDLDYWVYNGVGYLVIPLTGDGLDPIIAFFRADNLHLINYGELDTSKQTDVGWCAVSNDGDLYTSRDDATKFLRYDIDWHKMVNTSSHKTLTWIQINYPILDENGDPITIPIHNMQGGEFTDDGNLLYVSSGLLECAYSVYIYVFGIGYTWVIVNHHAYPEDGIHVFKTSNWQEIKHSTNQERNQTGCFDFSFYNGNCHGREPEGLTIWDLADGQAPHVKGGLHVLLDDHNWVASNNISLRHYARFKCPNDLTVFGTSQGGVPASSPEISEFLNRGSSLPNCATVTNDAPDPFLPGDNHVTFTVTDNATNDTVKCTANVKVVARHDECSTALLLNPCEKTVVDNYCATPSSINIDTITGYSGIIKDVWFKINKPYSASFSIETYTVNNGVTNTVMQLLSGTCGHLHEIASDDTSGPGDHAKITISNYTGSWPLYVRVTAYGGNTYGKFGILFKKIDTGSNIFNAKRFISGDTTGVFDHPTLTGDVNGDGRTDLIFPYYKNNIGIKVETKISDSTNYGSYLSYEDSHSSGSAVFDYPTLTGDVNGDGLTDLIFPFYFGNNNKLTIRTLLADPLDTGKFIFKEHILKDGIEVFDHPALTGDVNGDGRTDLIFVYHDNTNGIIVKTKMSNPSNEGKYISQIYSHASGNGVFDHPTLTGDVNGDGKTDLIFPFYNGGNGLTVRTLLASPNGNGSFIYSEDVHGDGNGVFDHPTLTGDVNGDGKTDLIFPFYYGANGLTIRTLMASPNGDGTYIHYQDILGEGNGVFDYPTLTGDVNGDGRTDLIFVGQDWSSCGLNVRVKFSNGDGTYCKDWQGMGDDDEVLERPTLTGDINGDGKTDLLFAYNYGTNGLTIRSKISQVDSCNQSYSNQDLGERQFLLFPNPTNGFVEIMTEYSQTLNVRVLNLSGMVLYSFNNINSARRLDLTSISDGVYFIDISDVNSGKRVVKKIVKIN